MKHLFLFITLLSLGQISAQQKELKSVQIAEEIHLLELENNKLILNEYISELNDSTSNIPIKEINKDLVNTFQNNYPELKKLKDEISGNKEYLDSVKNKDSEYRKYRANYIGSTGEERKKQETIYWKIIDRLRKSNDNFKQVYDENKKLQTQLNYLTLSKMANEYHEKGEILSTKFIPFSDLNRYKELSKVKENERKLVVLKRLYDDVLEKELRLKYDIQQDTVKKIEN